MSRDRQEAASLRRIAPRRSLPRSIVRAWLFRVECCPAGWSDPSTVQVKIAKFSMSFEVFQSLVRDAGKRQRQVLEVRHSAQGLQALVGDVLPLKVQVLDLGQTSEVLQSGIRDAWSLR